MVRAFFAIDKTLVGKSPFLDTKAPDVVLLDIEHLLNQTSIIVSNRVFGGILPSPFLKGIILSKEYGSQSPEILSHLRKLLPKFDERCLRVLDHEDLPGDLHAWMAQVSASFVESLLVQIGSAERELANMRLLYEKSQAVLVELERHPNRPFTTRIICQVLPGKKSIPLNNEPIIAILAQEISAVHALDLFFAKNQMVTSGCELIVEISGSRSARQFATWRVLEANVSQGWNRFYCPVVQEPLGEPLAISIRASSARAQSSLIETEQELVGGVSITPRRQAPFALRVWAGLVNVNLPRLDIGHCVESEDPVARGAAISRRELLHLGSAFTEERWPGQIGWNERDGGLMVHPAGQSPAVARIAGLQAVDFSTIKVICRLAHAEAAPTQFAIWIRSGDEAVKTGPPSSVTEVNGSSANGLLGRLLRSKPRSSETSWLTLIGEQEGELSLPIEVSDTAASFDLFLATRNLDNNNAYAWAVFTDIRFEQIGAQ